MFFPDKKSRSSKSETASLWNTWASDINCVFDRDPAARSVFEVLTTYPGVHAILFHRLSHRLWQARWRYAARLLSFIARFISNVDIHPGAKIGKRFFIDHGACVVIGETAEIGNDVTLYHGVTLGGTSWNKGKRHPTLGDGVLVGTGAKVLGPIMVGTNARIGANSVVVREVPDSSTVVGVPGRIVQSDDGSERSFAGVNLDHHLIPDPVGKAISCLLERLDSLETALDAMKTRTNAYPLDALRDCEIESEICEHDCPIGLRMANKTGEGRLHGSTKF